MFNRSKPEAHSPVIRWFRGLWRYYLGYTRTPVHTASAAALAIFGLLLFVDPLFAVAAIASYVLPPVVLYVLDSDLGRSSRSEIRDERQHDRVERAETDRGTHGTGSRRTERIDGDGDIDSDTDSDSDDGDTDSDSDDGDTDSDSDDRDTDSDSNDGDTDTDSRSGSASQ